MKLTFHNKVYRPTRLLAQGQGLILHNDTLGKKPNYHCPVMTDYVVKCANYLDYGYLFCLSQFIISTPSYYPLTITSKNFKYNWQEGENVFWTKLFFLVIVIVFEHAQTYGRVKFTYTKTIWQTLKEINLSKFLIFS